MSSVWSVLSTNSLGRWRKKEANSSATKRTHKRSNGVKYRQLVDDKDSNGDVGKLDKFLDGTANGENKFGCSDKFGRNSAARSIHSQSTFMSIFSCRKRKFKNSSKHANISESESTTHSSTASPPKKRRILRFLSSRKNSYEALSEVSSTPNDHTPREQEKLSPSNKTSPCALPFARDKEDAKFITDKSNRARNIVSSETMPGLLTHSRGKEFASFRTQCSQLENSVPSTSSPGPLIFSLDKEIKKLTADNCNQLENTVSTSSVSNRTVSTHSGSENDIRGGSHDESFTSLDNASASLTVEPEAKQEYDRYIDSSIVQSGLTEENEAHSNLKSYFVPEMASTLAATASINIEENAPKEQIEGYSLTKSGSADEGEIPLRCHGTAVPDILNSTCTLSANLNRLTVTEESGRATEVKLSLLIREKKKLFKELAANSLMLESVDLALHCCESKPHKSGKPRRSGVSRSRDAKSFSKRASLPSHPYASGKRSKPRSKQNNSALSMVNNMHWTVASPRPHKGLYSGVAIAGTVPHGFGTLDFANGDMYVGPFQCGEMHGSNAAFVSACGSLYRGKFQRNLKHGTGTEIMPNGDRYVGLHEYGFPHGFGILLDASGTIIKGGNWLGGALIENDTALTIENGVDDESVSSSVASIQSDVSSVPSVLSADSPPFSMYDDLAHKRPVDRVAIVPVAKNSPLTYSTMRRSERKRESRNIRSYKIEQGSAYYRYEGSYLLNVSENR